MGGYELSSIIASCCLFQLYASTLNMLHCSYYQDRVDPVVEFYVNGLVYQKGGTKVDDLMTCSRLDDEHNNG